MKQLKKQSKKCKCKYCKGRGLVLIAKDIKGLQECPYCNGTGVIQDEKVK